MNPNRRAEFNKQSTLQKTSLDEVSFILLILIVFKAGLGTRVH